MHTYLFNKHIERFGCAYGLTHGKRRRHVNELYSVVWCLRVIPECTEIKNELVYFIKSKTPLFCVSPRKKEKKYCHL